MRTWMALLFVVMAMAWAGPAFGDDVPSITTTGTATVYAIPDRAILYVGFSSTDKEIAKAREMNVAQADKLIKALKDSGVVEKDLSTERMSIAPHYSDPNSRNQDGFTASRTYAVTINDLKQVDKVFDAIVQCGVDSSPSISLEVSNTRKYKDQARAMAVSAAKEKAISMAAVLDSSVGKPRVIKEGSDGGYFSSGSNSNGMEMAVDRPAPDTPASLPIGRIAVEATVTVTFELK